MPAPTDPAKSGRSFTRRQIIGAAAAGAGAIAIGEYALSRPAQRGATLAHLGTTDHVLRPQARTVDLGGREVRTMTYGDTVPGPTLRLRQGKPVRIGVDNRLSEDTSVHWHGIRLRNAADGVPGFTQDPIASGDGFVYAYTPPDAGTYLYHSHTGMQIDRGLYGALIIESSSEPGDYDHDEVVMLDDWIDGIDGATPDSKLKQLMSHGMSGMGGGSGMGGMGGGSGSGGMSGMGGGSGMGGMSGGSGGGMAAMAGLTTDRLNAGAASGPYRTLSGVRPGFEHLAGVANLMRANALDVGDVRYPLYLVNGRTTKQPWSTTVRTGDRARLRFINAASDTTYLVFVEGHQLTVTHADGQAVEHIGTDGLVLGMGERYDVLVDVKAAARVIAIPLGKDGHAVAQLHTSDAGKAKSGDAAYAQPRRIASYEDLRNLDAPAATAPSRTTRLDLGMSMPYRWTIGGKVMDDDEDIRVTKGERQRFVMRNTTTMPHPMHLHGHSFRASGTGPLKDTIIVPPLAEIAIDWLPDNPGNWAYHCHDAYHMGSGMMRKVVVA